MPSLEGDRGVDVAFLDEYAETEWEVSSSIVGDWVGTDASELDYLAFHGRIGDGDEETK